MIFGEWGDVNARWGDDKDKPVILISHPNLHGAAVVRTKKQATSIALWLMQHADRLPDGDRQGAPSSPELRHGIDCAGGPFCRCGAAAP